ncbi:aldehyde dehydrogenase family protein [Methylovirgula sp. 4M-Z18]|uniref:aldehyde dehydrogenase family protein n=1 Tax=Methylovirgula sp. 4M-Z18 TaxID=2293567 RepID=UPI000E2EC8F3|nr:aldehyde dehydrogenase family protein [Methylovirgula sp. 4M-Z18]RFB78329.1 aldehyde dehydrogenase family protein [Methylovirgula sp. 4M-Z18]
MLSNLLPKSAEHYQMLIDGAFVDAADGRALERVSPAHGVLISRYARAGAAETERAIAAARQAFDKGSWPQLTGAERSKYLLKVAALIERDADHLALLDTLESGKPIAQARGELAGAVDIWLYAAALARDLSGDSYNTLGPDKLGVVVRDPIGVVSLITPWNFPFLIVSQKLPFALAAGCTCVVKPSEMTSASTLYLGKLLQEAGLPKGVINILAGTGPDVGALMTSDPRVDMVSFTGSTRVGSATMAAAAPSLKKVSMELGGKNPQIIFPDADLDAAADAVMFGAYFNAGECCNAGSRLLIHRRIAEEFVQELVRRVPHVTVGDPLDEATKVGALISADHLAKIESHVAGAVSDGSRLRVGGQRLFADRGHFLAPAIVDQVTGKSAISREELFGPVLSVLTFDETEEAITLANDCEYGLSASIWSQDFSTCIKMGRHLRAGTVWVNTFMDGASELPFGGYRKSGIGRELGRHSVADYTEEKTLHFHAGPRTARWLPDHA